MESVHKVLGNKQWGAGRGEGGGEADLEKGTTWPPLMPASLVVF